MWAATVTVEYLDDSFTLSTLNFFFALVFFSKKVFDYAQIYSNLIFYFGFFVLFLWKLFWSQFGHNLHSSRITIEGYFMYWVAWFKCTHRTFGLWKYRHLDRLWFGPCWRCIYLESPVWTHASYLAGVLCVPISWTISLVFGVSLADRPVNRCPAVNRTALRLRWCSGNCQWSDVCRSRCAPDVRL